MVSRSWVSWVLGFGFGILSLGFGAEHHFGYQEKIRESQAQLQQPRAPGFFLDGKEEGGAFDSGDINIEIE